MNFEHGMAIRTSGGERFFVHAPRWWNLVAHALWLWALFHRRTGKITLSEGGELRIVKPSPLRSEK